MAKQAEKQKDQFEEKVLFINRCAKVLKGGRKFSFSALILIGDGKGRIGIGFAKANEVSDAIRKGGDAARKNTFTFEKHETTIPHEVMVSWDGAKLFLKPAAAGTGVIAGSVMRSICELGGIQDVVIKSLGSNNPLNLVQAMVKALTQLRNRETCLKERGVR